MVEENATVKEATKSLGLLDDDEEHVGSRHTSACRRYFERHYTNARDWTRLEWSCFILLVLLLMYVSGGIASNVVNIRVWDSVTKAGQAYAHPLQIHLMIGAQCLLFVAVIISFLFLFLLRNILGLSLSVILLLLSALFFLALAIYLSVIMLNDEEMLKTIVHYSEGQISRVAYMFEFFAFQDKNKCCGIRSYKDWRQFGPKIYLVPDSVPESCCKAQLVAESRASCGLKALVSKDVAKKNINRQGCGKTMLHKYRILFSRYVIEDAVAFFLVLLALIQVIWLGARLWRKLHPKHHHYPPDPREQEDDQESLIVPGTPIKSYISSKEKMYYGI